MARSLNNPPSVAGRLLAQPRIRFPASPSRALTPRAWGQLPPDPVLRRSRRFTPTRVGTTPAWSPTRCSRAVHPHACGDNSSLRRRTSSSVGSPPRVWGQRRVGFQPDLAPRFTPTRVGTTRRARGGWGGRTVHPHACGDNGKVWEPPSRRLGSPPRVWGQRTGAGRAGGARRFTPTRVGTTPGVLTDSSAYAVHPHACGDNVPRTRSRRRRRGSPPRVWGQRTRNVRYVLRDRFTPTRVGTTSACWVSAPTTTVHPHACGDNAQMPQSHRAAIGSPPRVWGQRA